MCQLLASRPASVTEAAVLCVVYEPANENRLWQWEQAAKDTAGKPVTETQRGQRPLTRKQQQLLKAEEGE